MLRAADAILRYSLRTLPAWKWTEHLALWWGFKFRPTPGVTKLRSGALIRVDPTDYLQLMVYYFGTFEPHCLRYMRRCVHQGGTVIDIGANIGVYSLESSLIVGEMGRVISIEAAPVHAQELRLNIELNKFKNVSVIESAVSNAPGRATLRRRKHDNLGMFTLGEADGEEAFEVTMARLDDLLNDQAIKTIDLIKMDIEGSEYKALRGAERTLTQYKPSLLLELNEAALRGCQSSTPQIKEFLQEGGYRGWRLLRRSVEPIVDMQFVHECDECIFVHRDNISLMHRLRLM